MKKVLLGVVLVLLAFGAQAREQNFFLDKMSAYQLTVIAENNGVSQYTGSASGLSISFWANEKEVLKIIYTFADNNPEQYIEQILEVSKNLMPKQFDNVDGFDYKFKKDLVKLQEHRDTESMFYKNIHFDMKLLNGMITVTAAPSKYHGKF